MESKINEIINYDNYIMTKKENKQYYLYGFLFLFLCAFVFYRSIILSILVGILVFPFKKFYLKHKVKKRREQLCLQFRDLLYSLSASFSAGRQMNEALKEGIENLSFLYDVQTPMLIELKYITKCVEESRASEDQLIKDFAYRSGIEEIINFADVYAICRTTGGDVGQVVLKASEILMDKMSIAKEMKTMTAQKKYEARIISLMPFVLIVFLNFVSPGYLACMYQTLAGRLIMTTALAGIAISYYVMNIITEVDV